MRSDKPGNPASAVERYGNALRDLEAFIRGDDLEEAMARHKDEERICRQANDWSGLQAVLGKQAQILTARSDLDGALVLLQEQERLCLQSGNESDLMRSRLGQANLKMRTAMMRGGPPPAEGPVKHADLERNTPGRREEEKSRIVALVPPAPSANAQEVGPEQSGPSIAAPNLVNQSSADVPPTSAPPSSDSNRRIRVFISSTFRDMIAERDELMNRTWPELRRFCRERHVELVEIDLRWGIAEVQCTRRETLKLCLDEIQACRPFFVGMLGERYGWTPGDDAFTADLREEQPWLENVRGRSVTELEILHGVLNNPDMAGRAFFYFRDPTYLATIPERERESLTAEDAASAEKLQQLKDRNRQSRIPLRENYANPIQLAELVLSDLKSAIEAQFPEETVPDALTREERDHEAFAETRRRTYIGRPDYFDILDRHASADGGPLLVLGDPGCGKSALLANWIPHWRKDHPKDFIFQHYIGGTFDSADHWRLMHRLIAAIQRWSGDPEAIPTTRDSLRKDLPVWLNKARAKAVREHVRFVVVLDALNQLEDQEHARLLGWLPEHSFAGPLRLIVSTLAGTSGADAPLNAARKRSWQELKLQPLLVAERRRMIAAHLAHFGKKLDDHRLERLAAAPAAANPLFLKILLDDLRVTGTHDQLDQRLTAYLAAADITALLHQVLARYQRDYERDRPGLVAEALGLIYAARRGLTETELLQLLGPRSRSATGDLRSAGTQLPPALWTPLRAALEDSLVDRSGILNFAHDFLRLAVETAFAPGKNHRAKLRLRLADYFEAQPVTARNCDEIPWLLQQAEAFARLRTFLLQIDRFLVVQQLDVEELRGYWVRDLHEERSMGRTYLAAFEAWSREQNRESQRIAIAANELGRFLSSAALRAEAEPLLRRALEVLEASVGREHPSITGPLVNLAMSLKATKRFAEAEPLLVRALQIDERSNGSDHPSVAADLVCLAALLQDANRLAEAEPLLRRALKISETSFGSEHPDVADKLKNLSHLLWATNRLADAETLMRRTLKLDEQNLEPDHPEVGRDLNNLAVLLETTNRLAEAEPFMLRALKIMEASQGSEHPDVATQLNNLAILFQKTGRWAEAESFLRRALKIDEHCFGPDDAAVAVRLNNLAGLLQNGGQLAEAEALVRRALVINERSLGADHPSVAHSLGILAGLLQATNRVAEAEPLLRRALQVNEQSYGPDHPSVAHNLNGLYTVLETMNRLDGAEPILRRALQIQERSYGPGHPSVSATLRNLGKLLQSSRRFAEAEQLLLRALKIDEDNRDLPATSKDLNNLARLLQQTNRLADAEPLVRRALEIDEESFGPDHPTVAIRLNNLATLLEASNKFEEAERSSRRALDILLKFTRANGRPHSQLRTVVTNYGNLLIALGKSPNQARAVLHQIDPELLG